MTVSAEKKKCITCERELTINTKSNPPFYKSYSKWHKDGYLPICKKCLNDETEADDIQSFRNTLREIDKPFLYESWETAKNKKTNTLGTYLKDINLNFNTLTYDDSEGEQKETPINPDYKAEVLKTESKMDSSELIKRWGRGYTDSEYEYLENFYDDYANNYKTDTPAQVNLYKNIAKIHLQAEKELIEGTVKNYKDLMTLSSSLHNDGNIKPIQSTGANEDKGLSAYGLWIKDVENTEPCEYFKNKPLYEDYDKIKKYWNNWFVRPFKNIFNVSKDFDVKDD
jgi:hypothetical protein